VTETGTWEPATGVTSDHRAPTASDAQRVGEGRVPDLAAIAARLRRLEDKEALRGLMIGGWRALDRKDFDGWIACWTEDAEFAFGPWGTLRGRQAIHDKVVEAESPYRSMQHHLLNMHFEIDGDRATGVGYMLFVGVADEGQAHDPYTMGGPYEWEYVRTPAGWRLRRQRLDVWWTRGGDALDAFTASPAAGEP
jgi:ketosteroid isomerase-like protein